MHCSPHLQVLRDAAHTQCAWYITDAVEAFGRENGIGTAAVQPSAVLMASAPPHVYVQASRECLRLCCSVLFDQLRQPHAADHFVRAVQQWIVRIGTVLLSAGTYVEHQLLLHHLLRCPMPVADWATPLCQPIVDTIDGHCDARAVVDHAVAMLCTLLSPVRQRDEFLAKCLRDTGGDHQWTVVDDDGEEQASAALALSESDALALLGQFGAFDALYAHVLNMWTGSGQSNESEIMALFAFQLTLIKVLSDGAALVGAEQRSFVQLGKQLAHLIR